MASISGYGEDGPYAERKAYDLLIQAESGLASVTGGPDGPARVGVSVVDIATGMNAYEAILEALIRRGRTGEGADLRISMFDAMVDWLAVPLLQHEGASRRGVWACGTPPSRPTASSARPTGRPILISIQSDSEWRVLATDVMGDAALAADPAFATNVLRVARRADTDARVGAVFAAHTGAEMEERLARSDIAFARVSSMADLSSHPHLRRIAVKTAAGEAKVPAPAVTWLDGERAYGPVPSIGEHSASIRREFLGDPKGGLKGSPGRPGVQTKAGADGARFLML